MSDQIHIRAGPGVVSYRVKVNRHRGDVSLWGGAGVVTPSESPDLVLIVRVDPEGYPVRVFKAAPNTQPELLATLDAGEVFGVRVNLAAKVVATCELDTHVECALMPAHW